MSDSRRDFIKGGLSGIAVGMIGSAPAVLLADTAQPSSGAMLPTGERLWRPIDPLDAFPRCRRNDPLVLTDAA